MEKNKLIPARKQAGGPFVWEVKHTKKIVKAQEEGFPRRARGGWWEYRCEQTEML